MPKVSAQRKARVPAKRRRLEARVTDEQRELFQRAADLQGRAVQTIESMSIIRLTAEQSLKMAEAMLNPREPSTRLVAAARRYRKVFAGK